MRLKLGPGSDVDTLHEGLFACVRASQHGYAAPTSKLSLYDILDIFEVSQSRTTTAQVSLDDGSHGVGMAGTLH